MGPDHQRLNPAERANLVAYLDGELNEAESRAIATKLTQSVTARREIDALNKTWELLDLLPRPHASEDFTHRTLTQAERLSLPEDKLATVASRTAWQAGLLIVWIFASASCFLVGLVLIRWVWPDPTSRLARELTIAEHFDEYRDIGTFEFLEGLDKIPDFANDPN